MARLKRYQMYIDGQWVDAEGGKTFESFNPATGEAWAEIPAASEADVDCAVQAAHRAFTDAPWSTMLATERGVLLRNLAEAMTKHSEELGKVETIDTGKLLSETRWQAAYLSNYYAGLADKVHGDTLPIDKPDMWVLTVREPLGVVAAVVPWNSQLFLVAVKIAPALAAGNTVVLKASEHASAAMLEFGKVFCGSRLSAGRRQYPLGIWRSLWHRADVAPARRSRQFHGWLAYGTAHHSQLSREFRRSLAGAGWKVAIARF